MGLADETANIILSEMSYSELGTERDKIREAYKGVFIYQRRTIDMRKYLGGKFSYDTIADYLQNHH